MKNNLPGLLVFFFLVIAPAVFGFDDYDRPLFELSSRVSENTAQPKFDPKRIINQSNSFLKEREPEMTGEEYALYEKVVTMLMTNVDFALRMLEAMMSEKEPPSPAFEFILGNAYYAANDVPKAEKYYRSAVTRYPNFVRAWNNLGILYYTNNRFGDAALCFSKSTGLGDRDPMTFGLLGYCLEKEGDIVAAEMAYLQAVSGDAANPDWKERLLHVYVAGKQYGRAESLVTSLIKIKPNESNYWLLYAHILLADHRKLQAMAVLEIVSSTGVAGADELLLLGDLYAAEGLLPEAVAAYERALNPAQERGEQKLLHYARVLIATGKLSEAERVLAALKGELTPAGQRALLHARADLLLIRKRWPDARKEIETLLKTAPLDGDAWLKLGRAYMEEEDTPRATCAFETAYRIPEATYRACLELANVQLRNRHYAKSIEYLEKALSIERTDTVQDYLVRAKTLLGQQDARSG